MSPRAYRLGARGAAVADTRERVVVAARELFAEDGFHQTPIDEVARRADVARATVYHQFGSKLGLLEAVLRDFEARAGLAVLAALVEDAELDRLISAVVSAGCTYWATDPTLCRKILGSATADPAAAQLLTDHDAGRLQLLSRMVDRLADGGWLRAGCSPSQALDVLWLVTSFDAYDLLARGRDLSASAAARTLTELAQRQLRHTTEPPGAARPA